MRVALALVAVAVAVSGCRGRADREKPKAKLQFLPGHFTSFEMKVTVGPWSCGAVHDAQPLKRAIGRRGRLTLGAVADTHAALPSTIAAVERFAARFAEARVDAVAVLGDLGRSTEDVRRILTALGGAKAPLLALAGERESENAFHTAVNSARNSGLDVIDLVGKRLVATDDLDIVSLPGYPFTQRGCAYRAADLDGVRALLKDRGRPLVILGHMPPRGEGADGLDRTWGAVNVGDRNVRALVDELRPALALFAHVDEAGGHVEARDGRLYVNVGGADAVNGARAAIVRLTDGKASVEALP